MVLRVDSVRDLELADPVPSAILIDSIKALCYPEVTPGETYVHRAEPLPISKERMESWR